MPEMQAEPVKGSKPLLNGIVVAEFAHPLTEYAGLVLACLGAEVWLIEPPEGSSTRNRRPFTDRASKSRQSIPFLARNVGKKSAVIDPNASDVDDRLRAILSVADVVIEHESSPHRAYISSGVTPTVRITDKDGLGSSSIVGFAASGALSSSGWPHQPPCNAPSWLALDSVGTFAAAAALLMIRSNRLGGNPSTCEVPYEEAAISGLTSWTRSLHSYGMSTGGQGAETKRLGGGPFPVLPCRDGYIRIIAATPGQWNAFLQLLGNPEELAGDEWQSFQFRSQNFDAIFYIASEITESQSVNELFHRGQGLGLPITPVLDVAKVLTDDHVIARGLFEQIDDPELGPVLMLRAPVRTNLSGVSARTSAAPALGQHSDEIMQTSPRTTNAKLLGHLPGDTRRPLHGLRVLSMGVGAVIPEATSLLALLGADVIKIESMQGLDFFRQLGIDSGGGVNGSPTFNQANLGVKSCAINMAREEGRKIARKLASDADVIMENMRGTVMRKWGFDYDSIKQINPSIIYLSSQGLGSGPYDGYTTYGPNLQSFAGMTTLWAHPNDPYPVGSTLAYPDQLAGRQALSALLGALMVRDATGEGCYLDCTQFEVATWAIADKFLQQQLLPSTVAALGNRSLDFAPHGCYPCSEEDSWVAIAVSNEAEWQRFVLAIDEAWVREQRFSTTDDRLANQDELDELIGQWTHRRTPAQVEDHLRLHGVPVSRLVDGDSQASHKRFHESAFYTAISHPAVGVRWYTGLPFRVDGRRPAARRAPLLGEHSEYVFLDLLDLEPGDVSWLHAEGVIGT